jgi:hypothetical protein
VDEKSLQVWEYLVDKHMGRVVDSLVMAMFELVEWAVRSLDEESAVERKYPTAVVFEEWAVALNICHRIATFASAVAVAESLDVAHR